MKAAGPVSGGGRGSPSDFVELGEIQSLPDAPVRTKLRTALEDEEAAASLLPLVLPSRTTSVLDQVLGPRLTFDNPVWRESAVARLRALQKRLVEFALDRQARSDCMKAIVLVEEAVRLRLRWLQMQRSAEEAATPAAPARKTPHEEEAKAQ
ncbi:MAG TPA: hypothetical protein VIM12_13560 [Noviherbaspirillum sp.]|jgi:hypothetical protein|uniref:hypothetical protein n=1 Tax=Noviherbaspirillum sp. TaxID=1926288 RepID=UPI002F91EB35